MPDVIEYGITFFLLTYLLLQFSIVCVAAVVFEHLGSTGPASSQFWKVLVDFALSVSRLRRLSNEAC